MVKRLVFAVGLALFVKYLILDLSIVKGRQMSPLMQPGDRVTYTKLSFLPMIRDLAPRKYGLPVILHIPTHSGELGCLRVSGLPGDTVSISDGSLYAKNQRIGTYTIGSGDSGTDVLPADYSPRDNMAAFRVPEPGDSLLLDNISVRDFIYVYAMIVQENRAGLYKLQPLLTINDSLKNDYLISDFYAYAGKFCDIPDSFYTNWFFWDRLQLYIAKKADTSTVNISFLLKRDGTVVNSYSVKHRFYFMTAQDWAEGLDSRYFGPVSEDLFVGRPRLVLWSMDPAENGFGALRWRRLFRFI